MGALRLLWARDDFTVTSLAWATAGISFRLTVESVLKVQLASPCRAVRGAWWGRALSSEMKRGRARECFSSSRRASRTASWKTCCTCSKSRQAETSKNRHPNLPAKAAPSALVTCLVGEAGRGRVRSTHPSQAGPHLHSSPHSRAWGPAGISSVQCDKDICFAWLPKELRKTTCIVCPVEYLAQSPGSVNDG